MRHFIPQDLKVTNAKNLMVGAYIADNRNGMVTVLPYNNSSVYGGKCLIVYLPPSQLDTSDRIPYVYMRAITGNYPVYLNFGRNIIELTDNDLNWAGIFMPEDCFEGTKVLLVRR